MSENSRRFNGYINVSLRSFFGAMFVDVSEKRMRYTIGYFAIWTIYIFMEIGCLYAYFNANELSISPIYSIGTFISTSQVSYSTY